ncbi:alpha/beta fold hydrolase [Gracilibacillus sp. D59]|uniref:alpha/beta fold hydrolase n=1 Tax=Gracilibacillus sp. D59 TaxID=3457434 RepID=UPI003FCD0631
MSVFFDGGDNISYLNSEGFMIHYKWLHSNESNKKNVLVLLHGLGLHLNSWGPILPLLERDYDILLLDLPGHGLSDYSGEKPILDRMCRDLRHLKTYLQINEFHLIGQGLGGFVAIQYAHQYREEILSLTLIAVPINYPKKLGEKQVTNRKKISNHSKSLEVLGEELIPQICYNTTEENKSILREGYRKVNKEVYFELFNTSHIEMARKQLQAMNKPLLLLVGSEDPVYPPELFSATLNAVPSARFLTVPDASFVVQLDQPSIVAKWIHQFIQQKSIKNKVKYKYLSELKFEMERELEAQIERLDKRVNHISVLMLHRFEVIINGLAIVQGWGKRKAKVIFTYLILQKSVTRDELCDAFWPNLSLTKAKNQLRVSLHHLKKILEPAQISQDEPIVVTEREHVVISGTINTDYLVYRQKLENGLKLSKGIEKVEIYEECLKIASDNFFPGLYEDYFQQIYHQLERIWAGMAEFLVDWYQNIGEKQKELQYRELLEHFGFKSSFDT